MVVHDFNPLLSPFHASAHWLLSVGVPYDKVLQYFNDSVDYWLGGYDSFRKYNTLMPYVL